MKRSDISYVKLHEEKIKRLMDLHLGVFLRIGTIAISILMLIVVLWLMCLLGKI